MMVMKQNHTSQIIIFSLLLVMIGAYFTPVSLSMTLQCNNDPAGRTMNGQILFSPLYGTTTYLINSAGTVNHTWPSSNTPGAATYWLGDGTILRTLRVDLSGGGGAGGGVQKVEWDGTVVWDFRYDTNGYLSHHDIKPLPNGNVLMIAWETKTRTQAIAAGRDPTHITGNTFMPDHVIEVQPTGPTSGNIVWEWHVWDHLIQDFDPAKENYGVVGDHPELIDLNFGSFFMSNTDWLHTNSIDYNPEFNQILLSIHNFNEIWIIDHSTTTEEAAGHSGGNSGKGGDLLYRWGNPQSYDAGTSSDEKLFGQHDTTWIKPGCPGEGHILVFNNGVGRPGGQYSSVDELAPPVDTEGQYYLEPGSAYGPGGLTWSYTATPPSSFYSYYISGAQRLPDGNTLICDGVAGQFFEVTPEKLKVWQYVNPYPSPSMNDVFKIVYIPPQEPPEPDVPNLDCQGSMSWTDVTPGVTLHGSFKVQNTGSPNSTLDWNVDSLPDWGTWTLTPESGENLTPEEGQITVQAYVIVPDQENTEFEGFIHVINRDNPDDFCDIPIYLKTPLINYDIQTKSVQFPFGHTSLLYERINFLFQ
jgi:hypothetical protein